MRVAMVGTGYVGLISGACIADFGHQVICIDKDSAKISALTRARFRSTSLGSPSSSAAMSGRGGFRSARRLRKRWQRPMRCSSR